VVGLLRDAVRRKVMRERGRTFVEEHYSADIATDRLLAAYRSLGLLA
jgi:hypothetical protein